jgi:uridine monophosphate synthetase
VGLEVEDIVVFIDHEQGVKEKLKEQGYCGHSVLTLSEIAQTLKEGGRITGDQYESLMLEPT